MFAIELKMDLTKIFNQYLRQRRPPTLEVVRKKNTIVYRWTNCIDGFDMDVIFNNKRFTCSTNWSTIKTSKKVIFNKNLYVLRKFDEI